MAYHITDEQWAILEPILARPKRLETRGKKRQPDKPLLDGMLWVLKTGAQWHEMPKEYPPYQSCHRRFQEWTDRGIFDKVLEIVAKDMEERGKISLEECFIDGTFASAKKGFGVGPTKRGKGSKIMAIADQSSLPVAIHVASASPHEITLVEKTIAQRFTGEAPVRLVADKAYDSDPMDRKLESITELIAPHKENRKRKKTQDGRRLRRMKRRWKVERLNAWLQNFRSITTRWAYRFENYRALVLLGCLMILLRHY